MSKPTKKEIDACLATGGHISKPWENNPTLSRCAICGHVYQPTPDQAMPFDEQVHAILGHFYLAAKEDDVHPFSTETRTEAQQAIRQAVEALIAGAKPAERLDGPADQSPRYYEQAAYNQAVRDYEANLLKALTGKDGVEL